MSTRLRRFWAVDGKTTKSQPEEPKSQALEKPGRGKTVEVDLQPADPLYSLFLEASGVVEIDRINVDSPALQALKEAGVKIAVPLVNQGELIGVLNLGNRLSEQDYSTEDRRLLYTLATQAAPALRVAQLARQQQVEARQRERLEQEMRVARIIQETLLPKQLPRLDGWQVAAHWQPARAVGGDFYDFYNFPDGRLGVSAGDVTDKGVPAALVMATTRSILRAASERHASPGKILAQANEMLCLDIPANMFVTCLYIILDPASGLLTIANAGHNMPMLHTCNGIVDLRAAGMPLGLLPGMPYDEVEAALSPGDSLLIYSDGLVEAHNPQREMFGFRHLRELMEALPHASQEAHGRAVMTYLLKELAEFTGPEWEQEDDLTFLAIDRDTATNSAALTAPHSAEGANPNPGEPNDMIENSWQLLAEFSLPSEPGNEIQAMQLVVNAVQAIDLPNTTLERLKTAVAETTMNAIEHGNKYREDLPVDILVRTSRTALSIRITDRGGGKDIPEPQAPNLEAKLAGLQSPRGWGLFLIKNMVDEMHITTDEIHHTVELIFLLSGDPS
jgi:serine phosphatase RsbU (regulator of sigma subunit)/anti-sigma regulatory factor (Ser/Thr protein kinase)